MISVFWMRSSGSFVSMLDEQVHRCAHFVFSLRSAAVVGIEDVLHGPLRVSCASNSRCQ